MKSFIGPTGAGNETESHEFLITSEVCGTYLYSHEKHRCSINLKILIMTKDAQMARIFPKRKRE